MSEMIDKKIDIVLHGHKHCPFFARTKFVTTRYGESEVTVLAAGSACKPNPGNFSNAYNLIRIVAEGTIDVEQRHRDSPQGTFRPRHQLPIPVLGYEAFRDRSYDIALRNALYNVESETHNLLINEFGDSQCAEECRNLRVGDGERVEGLPEQIKTTAGTLKGLRVFSRTSTIRDPEWEPDPDCTDKLYKGRVRFSRTIASETGPVSFDISYYHFNAFALTKEQGKRMYDDDNPEYYKFFVLYPIRTLFITINFPSDIRSSSFDVFVQNAKREHCVLEETYCQQYLHVSELTRSATLMVPKPLLSHNYGISWQLPAEVRSLSTRAEGRAKLIRKQLLDLNLCVQPTALSVHPLQAVFEDIRRELLVRYTSGDTAAYFDVGLMVYDEQVGKLRHVAGIVQPEYWAYQLYEGEGVAGRAHKLNSAHLYARSRVRREMDWYASPPAPLLPHEAVFAVPLRYPVPPGQLIGAKEGSVIGVLWVGSTSPDSGLLDLFERPEEGDNLISEFHEDYLLERILPAIGLPEGS